MVVVLVVVGIGDVVLVGVVNFIVGVICVVVEGDEGFGGWVGVYFMVDVKDVFDFGLFYVDL